MKNISKKILAVIEIAEQNNYRVSHCHDCIFITKGKTNRSRGIQVWEDMTATRCDVDLSYTNKLKTKKDMLKALGLEE
jgi:hypothetical protein